MRQAVRKRRLPSGQRPKAPHCPGCPSTEDGSKMPRPRGQDPPWQPSRSWSWRWKVPSRHSVHWRWPTLGLHRHWPLWPSHTRSPPRVPGEWHSQSAQGEGTAALANHLERSGFEALYLKAWVFKQGSPEHP